MADPSEESLDPRFDPRYQRGYAAAPESGAAAASAPPRSRRRAATRRRRRRPSSEHRWMMADDDRTTSTRLPVGRDPFRVALLAGSLALVVIAFAIVYWVLQNPHYFDVTNGDAVMQAWQQLSSTLPPALLVAGLVGVGMWLALGVLDRRSGAAAMRPRGRSIRLGQHLGDRDRSGGRRDRVLLDLRAADRRAPDRVLVDNARPRHDREPRRGRRRTPTVLRPRDAALHRGRAPRAARARGALVRLAAAAGFKRARASTSDPGSTDA